MTNGYQSVFNLNKLLQRDPTSLTVSDGFFNNGVPSVSIANNQELKRIVIGNRCFGKVRVFELNGLSELESVVIGQLSFRNSDGSYRVVNCPKLRSIQIGAESFFDYHSFEISDLPSLQSIDIANWCFYYAQSFSLTGLID
jgi:hypothetical protein